MSLQQSLGSSAAVFNINRLVRTEAVEQHGCW